MELIRGNLDFAMYGQLKAWDHAAGVLLHREAGGHSGRADDGRPYQPGPMREGRYVPFGPFLAGGGLVALLAGLLSAVAVALVSRDFAQRRLDDCALMRVLGVSQRTMAWTYALQFAVVGLLASLIGLLAGWLCHLVFVALLADLVNVTLPAAGWTPYALGVGVGVLLTLGFGLPPVLQLARVPPLRGMIGSSKNL